MTFRTFETKFSSVSWGLKESLISFCTSCYTPSCYPCLLPLQIEPRSSIKAAFLGRNSWLAPWKVSWKIGKEALVCVSLQLHQKNTKIILCCHIEKCALQGVRWSLCTSLAGACKEVNSLLLSDCLVICITNELVCFRDGKQASINE